MDTPETPSTEAGSQPSEKTSNPVQPAVPAWLDAVRRLERMIGVPVERMVTSDTYFDLLTVFRRAQEQMANAVAYTTADVLALFNIPTRRDISMMREQIGRMERELGRLAKELEERESDEPAPDETAEQPPG